MDTHQKYDAELQDWLKRLSFDVSSEIHLVSTEEGMLKEGQELILDRPLPELLPHPNPLATLAEHQYGTLFGLRYARPNRKSQAGYALNSGEVKWIDVLTLNGHVLLFLLGDLQHRAYTVKPLGMSLDDARAKRLAELAEIAPDEEPQELDEDF